MPCESAAVLLLAHLCPCGDVSRIPAPLPMLGCMSHLPAPLCMAASAAALRHHQHLHQHVRTLPEKGVLGTNTALSHGHHHALGTRVPASSCDHGPGASPLFAPQTASSRKCLQALHGHTAHCCVQTIPENPVVANRGCVSLEMDSRRLWHAMPEEADHSILQRSWHSADVCEEMVHDALIRVLVI